MHCCMHRGQVTELFNMKELNFAKQTAAYMLESDKGSLKAGNVNSFYHFIVKSLHTILS